MEGAVHRRAAARVRAQPQGGLRRRDAGTAWGSDEDWRRRRVLVRAAGGRPPLWRRAGAGLTLTLTLTLALTLTLGLTLALSLSVL